MAMKTLVLGLGNPILRDDGVGLLIVQRLMPLLAGRPEVKVDVDYWGGLRLMERMVGFERVVIVDAICTGAVPGTVHVLSPEDMPTQRSASAHDVNLSTALELGRRAGAALPANANITLIGIEAAEVLEFGEKPTPEVEVAVPQAVEAVLEALGL